jgi:hypothetical protein
MRRITVMSAVVFRLRRWEDPARSTTDEGEK